MSFRHQSIIITTVLFLHFLININVDGFLLHYEPGQEFFDCCKELGMHLKTAKDACHFPPSITLMEQLDIILLFHGYISCYTYNKNNRDCCAKHGVDLDCQQFCDGADQPAKQAQKFFDCNKNEDDRLAISACNKAAYPPFF